MWALLTATRRSVHFPALVGRSFWPPVQLATQGHFQRKKNTLAAQICCSFFVITCVILLPLVGIQKRTDSFDLCFETCAKELQSLEIVNLPKTFTCQLTPLRASIASKFNSACVAV
jgi:hypothetical protein